MKFKLDENLPQSVALALRGMGLDAHTVAQERLAGADDDAVLRASVGEGRILVTLDLDFADIRAYPPGSHSGIWVIRPARQTFQAIEALVMAGIRLSASEPTPGALWIIDPQHVRIRAIDP